MTQSSVPPLKTPLARVAQAALADGAAISLDVAFRQGRASVILLRRGDAVRAYRNQCPHARWPLERFDGQFLTTPDGALICSAHGAVFDALTGTCLGGPGQSQSLTPVPVVAEGDDWVIGE